MNDFKKPHSLVSGANIIFSIGSFMYLYKKIEQLENENKALREDITKLGEGYKKLSNDSLQTGEFLSTIESSVRRCKKESLEIDTQFDALKESLAEQGIDIPKPKRKAKRKPKYQSSEESESYETPKRKPIKKKVTEVIDDELDEEILSLAKKTAK